MSSEYYVVCHNLVKIYKVAQLEVVALQGLDLNIRQGEMIALVGASGSGKSTLLNVIGGLDTPNAGEIQVGDQDLLSMNNRRREQYKREVVGFLWQQPSRNLLPYLSALENVELPMMLANQMTLADKKARAMELLEVLGLQDRAHFHPARLSGGEQQRAALAVALANNPTLLLADEPTGQVDSAAGMAIFDALRKLNEVYNTTVIIVTHDPQVAGLVDRIIGIRDGKTSTEIRRSRKSKGGKLQEDEWVILDRTGRLQLPQVYVDSLLMHGRVKVRYENDHISVWPDRENEAWAAERPGQAPPQWRPETPVQLSEHFTQKPASEMMAEDAIRTQGLWRTYATDAEDVHAVQDVDLVIPAGTTVVIKGRSGSGKTTLLNLIGGLDRPSQGSIVVGGEDVASMSSEAKIAFRRRKVGFIFQSFGLMPFLSARENIETTLRLVRTSPQERHARSSEMLSMVGLLERAEHRVHELSGGEQQRLAIARALVGRPQIILADEPTGQLDTTTGSNIIALLMKINRMMGITVVIASHDPKVEEAVELVFEMQDGALSQNRS
jgi:peptide/nickel transport system ATP-binding protein